MQVQVNLVWRTTAPHETVYCSRLCLTEQVTWGDDLRREENDFFAARARRFAAYVVKEIVYDAGTAIERA